MLWKSVIAVLILLADMPGAMAGCPNCGYESSTVQFSVTRPVRLRPVRSRAPMYSSGCSGGSSYAPSYAPSQVRYSSGCSGGSSGGYAPPSGPAYAPSVQGPAPADTYIAPPAPAASSNGNGNGVRYVMYAEAPVVGRHYDVVVRTHSQERHARKAAKYVRKAEYHAERS